ncbi:MAG: response regulator [Cyanobacteria bacterium P01_F01_bin.150]
MGTALVVEDSITDMRILVRCLQNEGINVLVAETGEEAMKTIIQKKPDVIILDVVLPGCSGYEVCRELKEKSETSMIPIIMCTTKGDEVDRFWGLRQGADAYLNKPIDQEKLINTVNQLTKKKN